MHNLLSFSKCKSKRIQTTAEAALVTSGGLRQNEGFEERRNRAESVAVKSNEL
jgi:hypothetical protein